MSVSWKYVSATGLVTVALSAPFAVPVALDSQGSAALLVRAIAPPAADRTVIEMEPLYRSKPVVRATHRLVHAATPGDSTRSSLASAPVRNATPAPRALPARERAKDHGVVVKQPIRRHPPAPVEPARAPDPAPALPTASVAAIGSQSVDLNSSDGSAPATPPAPVAVSAVQTAAPTATRVLAARPGDHGGGDGRDHGHGRDH